jgi:hypothetical protein
MSEAHHFKFNRPYGTALHMLKGFVGFPKVSAIWHASITALLAVKNGPATGKARRTMCALN